MLKTLIYNLKVDFYIFGTKKGIKDENPGQDKFIFVINLHIREKMLNSLIYRILNR